MIYRKKKNNTKKLTLFILLHDIQKIISNVSRFGTFILLFLFIDMPGMCLPCLEMDGGYRMPETMAICRYLAREFGKCIHFFLCFGLFSLGGVFLYLLLLVLRDDNVEVWFRHSHK